MLSKLSSHCTEYKCVLGLFFKKSIWTTHACVFLNLNHSIPHAITSSFPFPSALGMRAKRRHNLGNGWVTSLVSDICPVRAPSSKWVGWCYVRIFCALTVWVIGGSNCYGFAFARITSFCDRPTSLPRSQALYHALSAAIIKLINVNNRSFRFITLYTSG